MEAENSRPQADLLCQPCRLAPPAFEKAVAYGAYEGSIRKLVHLLKYDGMRPVARRLGELLATSLEALPQPEDAARRQMLVVPVPLHHAKHRRRGFNHATLLAQATVAAARNVFLQRGDALSGRQWDLCLVPGMLERRRATASQAGLTPRQRRQNLRGAFFAPRPGRLAGRHVLLIDDIYTTGATARACSRALLDAGAAAVWVATVARAQREGVARWDGFFLRGSTRSQVDSWMKVQRESVEGQVSS
jgi:ComF family protein